MAQTENELGVPVIVGETPVGFGVFARRAFRKGKPVGRIRGQLLDDREYTSDYCMEIGDDLTLEPAYPFRYLNHSCEPNCEIIEVEDEFGESSLWLYTCRPITVGEHLTIDYAWPADNAIPCRCGSGKCRGWIVDLDEVADLTEQLVG